jgi:hypothetical protein
MYGEIKISTSVGSKIVSGNYWEHDGMVTVRAADGRTKTTQVGGSPAKAMARILLRELEREKPD